jgi:Tol biopolymer transport system component
MSNKINNRAIPRIKGLKVPEDWIIIVVFIFSGLSFQICYAGQKAEQSTPFSVLHGPYLGQKPPGEKPEKFAPGIISTNAHEFSCAFSPDGKEFYFSRTDKNTKKHAILYTKLGKNGWSQPKKVNNYDCFEPFVSRDGKRLYFNSWKPVPGRDKAGADIWFSERTQTGWGEPQHLGHPFNPGKAMSVSETIDRTIYVTDLTGGFSAMGISRSRFVNGKYQDYEHLDDPLHFGKGDMYPFIAADESYLVFSSKNTPGKDGSSLFITFKNKDGTWNKPIFIDTGLPRPALPVVTPDEKYLFFTSHGDIYWMDATIIKKLKPTQTLQSKPI